MFGATRYKPTPHPKIFFATLWGKGGVDNSGMGLKMLYWPGLVTVASDPGIECIINPPGIRNTLQLC